EAATARRRSLLPDILHHRDLGLLHRLGLDQHVADGDRDRALGRAWGARRRDHVDVLHGDLRAEPGVERLGDHHRRGGLELGVDGGEQQAPQAGAEGGQADALAGIGQQDLADHLVNMILVAGLCRLARCRIDAEWKGEVGAGDEAAHWPVTEACVLLMTADPCGVWSTARQRPTLEALSAIAPARCTRVAVTTHCTVTHGCGAPAMLKVQPEMMQLSPPARIGAAAVALELDGLAVTIPPWGHIITLAVVSRPDITSPPARRC